MSKRASPAASNPQTSGSEEDERRRKRMLSNRESARRSRLRKQQRLDELINQAAQLKEENRRILMQEEAFAQQYTVLESENGVLRAEMMGLTERLQSLNSVLRSVGEFGGGAVVVPEIPDVLMRPWQVPCPVQPIMASADMFQC